jgi:hypothetical protein
VAKETPKNQMFNTFEKRTYQEIRETDLFKDVYSLKGHAN